MTDDHVSVKGTQRGFGTVVSSYAEFVREFGTGPPRSSHWAGDAVDLVGPSAQLAGVPSMLVERYGARYSIALPDPRGFALWGARRGWAQIGGEYDREVTKRRRDRAAAVAKGWITPPLLGGWHHTHVHVGVAGRRRIREAQLLAGLREMGTMLDTIWRSNG